MSGAFGAEFHHHRIPDERLIERRPRLDVFALLRAGALVDGTCVGLRIGDRGSQLASQGQNILIDDGERVQRIEVTWHSPLPWIGRPCFICPACGRGCYQVYEVGDVFACRLCHRLDWRSRHRNRFAPSLDRVARLRRKLGADQHAFAPLPPRPRHHMQAKRYDRLVAALAIEEKQIAAHLGRVVGDLTRRTEAPAREAKAKRELRRERNRSRRSGGT